MLKITELILNTRALKSIHITNKMLSKHKRLKSLTYYTFSCLLPITLQLQGRCSINIGEGMQAGIFRSHLESIRVITTPTSVSTHSQPVNQWWPNQTTPVKLPILLDEHTDYQEIKMNLAQVLKRKGKVCNSFQG